jgi:isoleucyl-tRNA synthetase
MSYNTYKQIDKQLNFPAIDAAIQQYWAEHHVFEKMCARGSIDFAFYEGPPSANGLPGIHHMLSRTTKDVALRYKTMQGYKVSRKSGWDTHGLPVELQVEKTLGITKKDIGTKISIEAYNKACRETVLKYIDEWNLFSEQMGYSVDLKNPYITCDNDYIESVWHIIGKIFSKGLLTKRFAIQPYSPAAGTSLSSHELNQPGCYKDVVDDAVTVKFRLLDEPDTFLLAWTTTPYTLPANAALAVGRDIEYVKIAKNTSTGQPVYYIVCSSKESDFFAPEDKVAAMDMLEMAAAGWYRVQRFAGAALIGLGYAPVFNFIQPESAAVNNAWKVYHSDHVTTTDGTGIVHISPAFGADDYKLHITAGVPLLMAPDEHGEACPLIDREGKFAPCVTNWAGRFFRGGYAAKKDDNVNKEIVEWLKQHNHLFKTEAYTHSYPHCWRTDKPVIYYPIDSWVVLVSAIKDRLVELNKRINWVPQSAGASRFGSWLENIQDWNLGRTRYWGTPLPIWATKDGSEVKCISSVAELKSEIEKSVACGIMKENPLTKEVPMDLHRPFIDEVLLVSAQGQVMYREEFVVDVWLDAGAMPYAQHHYPFENKEQFASNFPADFIAEGVDQTRGWFYTLHVLAGILFDTPAFKNVVCHGLVLDKTGVKMSKRLGNVINPVEAMNLHGADVVRFYIMRQTAAGDNLNFNIQEMLEIKSKFFGTLVNTFNFFCLYAGTDNWEYTSSIKVSDRPVMDRWIIACQQNVIDKVTAAFEAYRFSDGVRAMYDFVIDDLSNWYVRLNRKRFWNASVDNSKQAAYQTLYEILIDLSKMLAPVCPFLSETMFSSLNPKAGTSLSVHTEDWPVPTDAVRSEVLVNAMPVVRSICSAGHKIRKKAAVKVRQPLSCIYIDAGEVFYEEVVLKNAALICQELNIKTVQLKSLKKDIYCTRLKPNYKKLGRRAGSKMKELEAVIAALEEPQVLSYLDGNMLRLKLNAETFIISNGELDIIRKVDDEVVNRVSLFDGKVILQVDTVITEDLRIEGLAREVIKEIQDLRKGNELDLNDKIRVKLWDGLDVSKMLMLYEQHIRVETQAVDIALCPVLSDKYVTQAGLVESLALV